MTHTCAVDLEVSDGSLRVNGSEPEKDLVVGRYGVGVVDFLRKIACASLSAMSLCILSVRRRGLTYFRTGIRQTRRTSELRPKIMSKVEGVPSLPVQRGGLARGWLADQPDERVSGHGDGREVEGF